MSRMQSVKFVTLAAAVAALLAGAAFALEATPPAAGPAAGAPVTVPVSISPVTEAMLRNPDPGSWLMWRGNQSAWQHSQLKQITPGNVKQLRLVWSRGIGTRQQRSDAPRARRHHVPAEPLRPDPGP